LCGSSEITKETDLTTLQTHKKLHSLSRSQSSKGSYSWEYRGGYISLLSAKAFVEIEERLYSADTKNEPDPKTNAFIVQTKWD